MTSIKLKFRKLTGKNQPGTLYFQIIHKRTIRQIKTDCHIYDCEWDSINEYICHISDVSDTRNTILASIRNKIAFKQRKLEQIIKTFEGTGKPYTADDIIKTYRECHQNKTSVFEYISLQSERQKNLGRLRTSETYRQALNSFMKFRNNVDLHFDMLDADMIEKYERHMRTNNLCRNTTSFYMRVLRCIYNRAIEDGLAKQNDPSPFKRVYTGVDKTAKRAITLKEIKRIKELDLASEPDLEFARDIFLFSFYMRGMAFIDMAYLRKKDLSNGHITYIRKKTGQQLCVRWEKPMQEIIEKYPQNPTQYLLPIITSQDGNDRQQYLNRIMFVNRKLKKITALANIPIPLSTYVSRHSWASIAHSKHIPLSIISEGMGHDKEETTRIYLASIKTSQIDEANNRILKEL